MGDLPDDIVAAVLVDVAAAADRPGDLLSVFMTLAYLFYQLTGARSSIRLAGLQSSSRVHLLEPYQSLRNHGVLEQKSSCSGARKPGASMHLSCWEWLASSFVPSLPY
jgi:hypothetical protein